MAEKLSNIIQVDGADYEVHAVDSEKLGGVEAGLFAKKDDIPTLIVVNKTSTDTQDSIFAVTNLVEDGDKAHRITPTYTSLPTKTYVDTKQAQLVSGTNIKTINGNSILGSGNLTISGGNGGGEANNGTLTIQKNGTNVATFTANSADNVTANITVPTITDSLTSTSTTAALSANQGRILNEKIKNITVSQNEPTGGAAGDIWFKY